MVTSAGSSLWNHEEAIVTVAGSRVVPIFAGHILFIMNRFNCINCITPSILGHVSYPVLSPSFFFLFEVSGYASVPLHSSMQSHATSFFISGMCRDIFPGSLSPMKHLMTCRNNSPLPCDPHPQRLQAPCCEVVLGVAPMGRTLLVSVEGQGVLAGIFGSSVFTPELRWQVSWMKQRRGTCCMHTWLLRAVVFNGFPWFFPPWRMFQALLSRRGLNHYVKVSSIDSCRAQELLGVKVHHLMTRPQDARTFFWSTGTVSQIIFGVTWLSINFNGLYISIILNLLNLNGRCLVVLGQPLTWSYTSMTCIRAESLEAWVQDEPTSWGMARSAQLLRWHLGVAKLQGRGANVSLC